MAKNTTTAEDVDAYLAAIADEQMRKAMETLRETIQSVAPDANEVISYKMPAFMYKGMLVYYCNFKKHYSLFLASHGSMAKFVDDIAPYKTSTGTLQFDPAKPLPKALIKKLVKARVKENEAKAERRL
jgi:uncharacterized protein YdhG (YjbR/CyaY superfamily)